MNQQNLHQPSPLTSEENVPVIEKRVIETREDFFAWFLPPYYSVF